MAGFIDIIPQRFSRREDAREVIKFLRTLALAPEMGKSVKAVFRDWARNVGYRPTRADYDVLGKHISNTAASVRFLMADPRGGPGGDPTRRR